MDRELIIRKAIIEDLERCILLLRCSYESSEDRLKWTYCQGKKYIENYFNSSRSIGYVIEENYLVQGVIFATIIPGMESDEVYIEELLVDKSAKDKGYETKLLGMIEGLAMELDLKGIILSSKVENINREFIRNRGFEPYSQVMIMKKVLNG